MLRMLILLTVLASCESAFSPIWPHQLATAKHNRHDSSQPLAPPRRSVLCMSESEEASPLPQRVSATGLVAQPVVWISLYFVATTGAGLPAGPFGFVGAMEGVSYLVVVGLVVASVYRKIIKGSDMSLSTVENLSCVTLAAGFFVLASLVVQQGCVPNAKPIIDYSDYLPVCQETPGLFGE